MIEEWKPVRGHENAYEVSTLGNVRSIDRVLIRKTWKNKTPVPKRYKGKLLSPVFSKTGYHTVKLVDRNHYIHRLVAQTFLLPAGNSKPEVNHINSEKTDNRLENLEWASRTQNLRHMVLSGNHGHSDLSEKDIQEIRDLLEKRVKRDIICQKFNICRTSLKNIKTKKTWGWLK